MRIFCVLLAVISVVSAEHCRVDGGFSKALGLAINSDGVPSCLCAEIAKKYALVGRAPSDGFKFRLVRDGQPRFLRKLRAEIIKAKKHGGNGKFGCAVVSKYGRVLAVCYVPQGNRC